MEDDAFHEEVDELKIEDSGNVFDKGYHPLTKHKEFDKNYLFWAKLYLLYKLDRLSKRFMQSDINPYSVNDMRKIIKYATSIEELHNFCNLIAKYGIRGLKTYSYPVLVFYEFLSSKKAKSFLQIKTNVLEYFMRNELDLLSSPTKEGYLVRILDFLHYVEKYARLDDNASVSFNIDAKAVYGVIERKTTALEVLDPEKEYKMFFEAIDTLRNSRDRLLLKFILLSGLRVHEATGIKNGDIHADDDLLVLKIIGKGNKVRENYIAIDQVADDLEAWATERKKRESEGDLFFCTSTGKRLRDSHVNRLVERVLEKAGIKRYKKKGPHLLRHSFATYMVHEGNDISLIKEWLGHSSIATTTKYLHPGRSTLGRAAPKIKNKEARD